MTILLTGSEGFIGSALRKHISSTSEEEMITFDLIDYPTTPSKHFCGDLSEKNLSDLLSTFNIDCIVHIAAQTDVITSLENPLLDAHSNIMATLKLLDYAKSFAVKKFIYINSGGAIYAPSLLPPYSENSLTNPVSPYGLSKLTGELYVKMICEKYGIAWTSLALANVFGRPISPPKDFISKIVHAAQNDEIIHVYGPENTRDYIFIADVVEAISKAISSPGLNQRVNIATGVETSNIALFNHVIEAFNLNPRYEINPSRPGEVARSSLNTLRAMNVLGWSPNFSLERGLLEMRKN